MSWSVDSLSYDNRKEITIQTTNLDANQTDFPVLVKFTADADIGAIANADGFDIRFTASDGETLLKYERQSFAIASGEATGLFWVKTDLSTAGTSIYIYYRSTDTADGADPTNVWDSNYVGVWHLQESGDGTSDEFKDSTANANHGTGGDGNSAKTPDRVTGKIGYAQDFVRTSDDHIRTTDSITHNIGTGDFTFEAWVKPDEVNADWYTICSNGAYNPGFYLTYASVNRRIGEYWTSANGQETVDLAPDTNWQFTVLKRTSGIENFIRNATISATTKDRSTASMSNADFVIGQDTLVGESMNGLIQEVRFSKDDRSDAWLKFEYYNFNEADNELTWGDEETPGGGTNIQINISDTFKTVTKVQINISDTWKNITKAQVNIGDVWKSIFP